MYIHAYIHTHIGAIFGFAVLEARGRGFRTRSTARDFVLFPFLLSAGMDLLPKEEVG